ncbi:hypothetical protein E4U09_001762 [Claviceps aff. purpurea]|uniref:Microbial-type PARG catalytic domain-containing protein n=1 Tax=Claviceps aff. purpurea TaxID=1967640 RepID=A0A9P7U4K4_9HYPO|nr:hypothetical protein E4U09_001762 [Claviceps aff. purpurea]
MDAGHLPRQEAGETENLLPSGPPPVLSRPISYEGRRVTVRNTVQRNPIGKLPKFRVVHDDPVTVALDYAKSGFRVPFICAANRFAPGERHDDQRDRPTYEEDFCGRRRGQARPGTYVPRLYPIPATGGIFSDRVVVYLGPRGDNYENLDPIPDLPVVLVHPVRKPPVQGNGTKYLSETDELVMGEKIREAIRICLHHNYDRIVIGDFGLGDGFHHPPQAVAKIWRELLLFNHDFRGRFESVDFAFIDPVQSTTKWFRDERHRRNEETRIGDSASTSRAEPPCSQPAPTDMAIFESVFDEKEIERVLQNAAMIDSQAALINSHLR